VKALTVCQPHAERIRLSEKRVENRTWKTGYRGRIAIHAGQAFDTPPLPIAAVLNAAGLLEELQKYPKRGLVLGTVELVDIVEMPEPGGLFDDDPHGLLDDPLATGPFCWLLDNPIPLERPLPASGKLGLWDFAPLAPSR